MHPVVVFELRDGRRISRQLLLDANGVLREGPRLQAAIAQAVGEHEEGPDAGFGDDRST